MDRQPRGLALISGGLDSRLGVCVLRDAGAYMEGVCFETPFFSAASARQAAEQLRLKLHVVDFTADEIALIKHPPHGFGGAMNPCIDCHATMIRRAGELMRERGFDFVSTGEVLNQRPMSQNDDPRDGGAPRPHEAAGAVGPPPRAADRARRALRARRLSLARGRLQADRRGVRPQAARPDGA